MQGKVAILNQGYIPHYRLRFFELLAQRGGEYVVFHGAPPSWIGVEAVKGPFAFPQRWVRNREIRIGSWTAIYQPVIREILTGGYDAVVLSAEAKYISNIALALAAPLRRIAVLYWGFGYHPQRGFRDSDTPQRGMFGGVNFLKDAMTRMADGYLAYTTTGVEKLVEFGYPRDRVFVLQNTIDITEQRRLCDQVQADDPAQIRAELGLRPDSTVGGPSRTKTSTLASGNKVVVAAIPSVVGERSIRRKSLTGPSSSGPGSAKRSSAVPICIAKRDGPPRCWSHQSSQLSATDRQKFSSVSLLARKKSSGILDFLHCGCSESRFSR